MTSGKLIKKIEGHVESVDYNTAFGLVCITCGKILAELPDLSSPHGAVMVMQADHAVFFTDPHEVVVVNMGDNTCLEYPRIPDDVHLH